MLTFRGAQHIVRSLFRRQTADAETMEELADHIARQTQKHVAEGMSPSEAERMARIELGGIERYREETAEARPGYFIASIRADCRYALKSVSRRPTFLLVVLLTLGFGLGAGNAIGAVLHGALYKPLPYPEPRRLMAISLRMPVQRSEGYADMVWSYPKFGMFRQAQTSFASLSLHSAETLNVQSADGVTRISGEAVSSNYFSMLGAVAAKGRVLVSGEDEPGSAGDVVVISDSYWKTALGSDASVLRRGVIINGVNRSVVGVMPPGFHGLSGDAELWLPISGARSAEVLAMPDAHNMELIGRLRAEVSAITARENVASVGAQIDAAFPTNEGHWGASAELLDDLRVAPAVRRALWLLGAIVGIMLLMVGVNLTTLFLTRTFARQGELAVRIALGASRVRVVQQVITESMIVCAAGGAFGALAGFATLRWITNIVGLALPTSGSQTQLTRVSLSLIGFDIRNLIATVAIALAIGVTIGAVAAFRATRHEAMDTIRRSSPGAGMRSRSDLVVAQIALAVLLLVVSGLTVDSLRRTLQIPLGYQPDKLISVKVSLDARRVGDESSGPMWQSVLAELDKVSGVTKVAFGSCAPIGMHCEGTGITPLGHSNAGHVSYHIISAGYFATLGTSLVRGRDFDAHDVDGAERVMIINRAAASAIWGNDDPLRTPVVNGTDRVRVIGIVEDARYEDVEQPAAPAIFVPITQADRSRGVVFVRAKAEGAAVSIREAIKRAATGSAVSEVRTMRERLRDALARNRLIATMVSVFATVALALAALGVYGSLSLAVLQRQREFAIRRALGANRTSLMRMVVVDATRMTTIGGVLGLVLAFYVGKGVSALLYDTRPLDLRVYGVSLGLLAMAVALAATVPTLASVRADPRDAMRAD